VLASLKLEILDLPQPAAGILMSPWFDMASNSFQGGNALVETDYVTTANTGVPLFAKWWLGDHDPRSPDVNPLYCSVEQFKKLPPQLILVGGGDFVLPECRDLSRMFAKAGLRHEMVVERGEFHLYALGSNWTKRETRDRTDKYILGWMKNALQV
jgi:acetyl esterase/lipase